MGYTGRKCQIQTVEPAADLMPPKLENFEMSNTSMTNTMTESSVEQVTNKINRTTSISMVNSHQGHWDFEQVTEEIQGTTIEPLGPIVITDPPSTVDPAATAGKWPIELESENPLIDSEIDNET